jgi:hypothetical protein
MRETFLKDVHDVIDGPFTPGGPQAVEPFASQRRFFNVYALWWPDVPAWDPDAYSKHMEEAKQLTDDLNPAASHWSTYNEMRDRLFLPWQNEGKGWVTHLAMPNSRGGGGGAGLLVDRRVGDAMIEGNDIPPFYHEFSHTAMMLGDKYIGWGMWGRADESSNTTLVFQREKIKWKAWIDPKTPVPTPYNKKYIDVIGLSEGAVHRPAYIFRTTPVCTMGVSQFATHLCAVCIQSAAQRTYIWVNPIENPQPSRTELKLKRPGRAHFSISRVKSDPDTQKVEWRLNGKLIATDVDSVDVNLGAIARYELVCSLVDKTKLIREDPPYASFPRASRTWKVVNERPTSKAKPLRLTLKTRNASCFDNNDGTVAATVTGGKRPYTCVWSNGAVGQSVKGLGAGKYSVRVFDSEYRSAAAECEVQKPASVTVQPRSVFTNGKWDVVLATAGAKTSELKCRWATGAKGLALKQVADGTYKYVVTHRSGSSITGEVQLKRPQKPLDVAIKEVIPSTGENNGEIRLDINGGRRPYTVMWADNPRQVSFERLFLPPGDYRVVVKDANDTIIEKTLKVRNEPSFVLDRPTFERSSTGGVRVAEPKAGWQYIWYARLTSCVPRTGFMRAPSPTSRGVSLRQTVPSYPTRMASG